MKFMNAAALAVMGCLFSVQAAFLNVENELGEEALVIISTDRTFGITTIKVEFGPGERYKTVDIGSANVKNVMVLVGSLRTGRVAYAPQPGIIISAPVASVLPVSAGSIVLYKDREGNMRYAVKDDNGTRSGVLVRH